MKGKICSTPLNPYIGKHIKCGSRLKPDILHQYFCCRVHMVHWIPLLHHSESVTTWFELRVITMSPRTNDMKLVLMHVCKRLTCTCCIWNWCPVRSVCNTTTAMGFALNNVFKYLPDTSSSKQVLAMGANWYFLKSWLLTFRKDAVELSALNLPSHFFAT